MGNFHINQRLINEDGQTGVLPHLDNLKKARFVFGFDFGLPQLPTVPEAIFIRGPRQYGKSA